MDHTYTVRQLMLSLPFERRQLELFLSRHQLRLDSDVQTAFGLFDQEEQLVACGCAAGRLLKCFAIDSSLRGQNILGALISHLVQERFSAGIYDLAVITRVHNLAQFTGCGMHLVAQASGIALLENRTDGPEQFAAQLRRPGDEGKKIGAVVMNCNPFTKGHRALVEYAASHCELLYVFVVDEDRSLFPTRIRLQLVQEGVADLPNIRVALSGNYMISSATFPTYFLKQDEDAVTLQAELDAEVFAQRIAPALHITCRFAGQEPLDPTTARYNDAMRRILPAHGIAFCEIPRITQGNSVISASRVRAILTTQGVTDEVLAMVPESTARFLTRWAAEPQHGSPK